MALSFEQLVGQINPAAAANPLFLSNPGGGDPGFGPIGSTGGFLPNPGGGSGDPNPIVTTIPVVGGTTGGTTGVTNISTQPASWGQQLLNGIINYFTGSNCGVADLLLRIALFILGLMAIAGAIYLYKGSGVLSIPTRIVRTGVKAAKHAGRALESTAGEAE